MKKYGKDITMLFKTAIVDDSEKYIDIVAGIISIYNSGHKERYIVTKYTKSFMFLEDLENGIIYDVYLLDIEMPYKTGLDIAEKIHELSRDAYIIFITAYKQYALDGYKYRAFRYIYKFNLQNQLTIALNDLSKYLLLQEGKYLLIQTSKFKGKLHFKDIIYIYKDAKDTVFVLNTAKQFYKYRKTLEDVYILLPKDDFFYIDRCFIINIQYVDGIAIDTHQIVLKNGEKLNISKSRLKTIKEIMLQFWSDNL